MTNRVLLILACASTALAPSLAARAQSTDRAAAQPAASWSSPSLRNETVVAPNGAVTTSTALLANDKWGIGDRKRVEKVTDGVYAMRGWGIASSFAIEAPAGWIVIDTGDHTPAAMEMRAMLEQTLGRKIKVAAILLTHLHYANGSGAFLDPGAEIWGHEHLDRNMRATTGISVLSGTYQARAAAQFGVFHPTSGPDAFPNKLGFTPEKLLAGSSYQPPTQLFPDGRVVDLVVAGMPVQVAPLRTDTSDSVGFYFPGKRLLVTNCMPYGAVFNIYSLRGGSYRNPAVFIQDARWVESKDAQIVLDIHGPTVKGEDAVRDAVQRAVDQVQLIHDQTLRQIAHGLDARQAAEQVYMPRNQRGDWENYGQVESHVQQVFNGTMGWFGGDVYDINPLSGNEEAARTVQLMGGAAAVRKAAAGANAEGGLANWRWTLKLTSLLLELDASDAEARQLRAAASRQLGQRTSAANVRGWYLTEALQIEGGMQFKGQPLTVDAIRHLPRHAHRAGARRGIRGREPAVRALPRRSAQGRGAAPDVHARRRRRLAHPAARAAQRRARDHRCGRRGTDAPHSSRDRNSPPSCSARARRRRPTL